MSRGSSNNLMSFKRLRSNRRDNNFGHQNEEVIVTSTSSSKSRPTQRPDPFVISSAPSMRLDPSNEDLSDSGQRIVVTRLGYSAANSANLPAVEFHQRPVVQLSRHPSSGDLMRKDKGKERERADRAENYKPLHHREAHSKKHTHEESDGFTGSLAAAEFERLKKENESLKKSVKKQTKKIEEMKAQLQAGKTTKRENEDQVRSLKSKVQNNEEFIATIESTLQCQICMDTFYKPFALAPCGHVYCLSCLQDWFKKAPASGDDMDIDPEELDDPEYIISRQKTCPTCRGVVARRPAPLFVVNNIVSAFRKAKGLPTPPPPTSPNAVGAAALASALSRRSTSPLVGEEDPWDGIFYEDADTEDDMEDDMEDEMGSEYMYGYTFGEDFYSGEESYDEDTGFYDHSDEEIEEDEESASEDDEDHDVSYIYPHWEPPSFVRGRNRVPHDSAHLALVRRGCTEWMINRFHMEYTHGEGLIAYLHSFNENDLDYPVPENISPGTINRLFLGWNVQRYDHTLGRRMTGKEYIRHVLRMLRETPEKFIEEPGRTPGTEDIHMLVRADETMEYDTTDSEFWA